ncbi:hypothetical protein, partial [Mesorhizobium sp. M7A.F.Ca.CA.001.09.1.1]|uniref:hypothetical protein n=1 Tax=Mesorhizobium sp. M7A.F.Ca.CA.001.09.1.1 TaxID=2496718 RepID=UPI0019CF61F4
MSAKKVCAKDRLQRGFRPAVGNAWRRHRQLQQFSCNAAAPATAAMGSSTWGLPAAAPPWRRAKRDDVDWEALAS